MSKKKKTVEELENIVDDLEWKIYDLQSALANANRQNYFLWKLFSTMKADLDYE